MRERPILFSAPMVRAILAGSKTQTRRVLAPRGLGFIDCCCGGTAAHWVSEGDRWHCGVCGGGARLTAKDVEYLRCPYGQPGDRLWVREAFMHEPADYCWEASVSIPCRPASTVYRADFQDSKPGEGWKPSIHMPRWASRILLEVTAVRVERLQEIREADCIAEGCAGGHGAIPGYAYACTPLEHYHWLWNSINGPGAWESNPWVWVVEFKRTAEPGKAIEHVREEA